jgi:hypothetical protein
MTCVHLSYLDHQIKPLTMSERINGISNMLLNNKFLQIQSFLFKELCEIMKYNNICEKFTYKVSG